MAKINKPKAAPHIDMTPMVDLGFLLVTFFMLSAKFRTDEVVVIDQPASISQEIMPTSKYMQITVNKWGKVFMSFDCQEETKKAILAELTQKAGIQLSNEAAKTFLSSTEFGAPFSALPKYLTLSADQRKAIADEETPNAIPVDSTHNELKTWVKVVYQQLNEEGKAQFEKMIKDNPNMADADRKKNAQDLKPKVIIKADRNAPYHFVRNVVNTFKDLDMDTKFSFITTIMADPRTNK